MGRASTGGKTAAGDSGPTVIAAGNRFNGELGTSGPLTIEGRVEGEIEAKDLVVVAPGGTFEGKLRADTLEVAGEVHGTVYCRSLNILPQGRVQGAVLCEQLCIAQGGTFRGERQAPGLALPLLRERVERDEALMEAAS